MDQPIIQKNIPLAPYTTFKVGGPADFFCETTSADELRGALDWALSHHQPYYIIGSGSNLLVADHGVRGLVIKNACHELRLLKHGAIAGAGVALPKIAKLTAAAGLAGLEFAIGVPGTIGGAVRGNAGAFGQEIKDTIKSVSVIKVKNQKIQEQKMSKRACHFGYRASIFKKLPGLIIVAVTFSLKSWPPAQCQAKIKSFLGTKINSQPLGARSAGSIFKNPAVAPAWELITEAEMRGRQIGGAKVSEDHANFIINTGNATAEQIVMLIAMIKQRVRVRFGVQLQEEIQYLGF